MPLSCKSGEKPICSVEFDAKAWNQLRSLNASDNRLRMDCCGSQVTLKTSKLGTQFFAHKRRGTCTSAAETAEHLFVKASIAQAIYETEWDAKTEVRGQASHGAVWVADVLATKGKHHIAFEVQWSPQTLSETSQRQSLYQDSNVRCLWLFKRPSDIQASKEVPSVLIDVTLDPLTAWVWIPIATIGSYMRDSEAKKADYLWNQKIELRRFIRGCLARKFFWAPGLNQTVPLEIWTAEQECWKCHRPTSIITSLNFCLDGIALGAKSISMKLEDFDNPAGIACLTDALKTAELRSHGIGVVKQRFSRTRGHAYLSNGCVHCDALQGAFFEHQVWHEAAPTLTVRCRMVEELFSDESQDTPYRWAFDERFEEVESIKALTSDPISNSVMSA